MLKFLFSLGVDSSVRSSSARSSSASSNGLAENGAAGVIRNLLSFGADPDAADAEEGLTPLHLAAKEGPTSCVKVVSVK